MYLKYWGLKISPFENLRNPDFLYFSSKHDEALNRLIYAAKREKERRCSRANRA
jgi:type II secretory pathway predicted ATPase ExeA